MPARRSYQRHSSESRPSSECSHTRDVADSRVALFDFSSDSRKKTCSRPRPRSPGAPGAGRCGADRITEIR